MLLFYQKKCSFVRDDVTWTSMMDGYMMHSSAEKALELFNPMLLSDVDPNEVTIIVVFWIC